MQKRAVKDDFHKAERAGDPAGGGRLSAAGDGEEHGLFAGVRPGVGMLREKAPGEIQRGDGLGVDLLAFGGCFGG
ncbi:MAG TPA: hypothetical protein VM865_09580 [Acidobacteriaceae bacterium]|nr:hypothetical protein [Acidobacteriaceae bacterium]